MAKTKLIYKAKENKQTQCTNDSFWLMKVYPEQRKMFRLFIIIIKFS